MYQEVICSCMKIFQQLIWNFLVRCTRGYVSESSFGNVSRDDNAEERRENSVYQAEIVRNICFVILSCASGYANLCCLTPLELETSVEIAASVSSTIKKRCTWCFSMKILFFDLPSFASSRHYSNMVIADPLIRPFFVKVPVFGIGVFLNSIQQSSHALKRSCCKIYHHLVMKTTSNSLYC